MLHTSAEPPPRRVNGHRHAALFEGVALLPTEMREARRWLVWRGKKIPHYVSGIARNGTLDGPEDVAHLAPLDEALAALDRDASNLGLGFALGFDAALGAHWQGLDLDDALAGDAFTTERAAELYEAAPGYAERSPSREGLHVIGIGAPFRSIKWKRPGEQSIEAYSAARYFTVTADLMRQGALEDLAPLAERIRGEIGAKPGTPRAEKIRRQYVSTGSGDYLARQSPELRAWLEAHPIEEALAEHGYVPMGDRWLSPRSDSGVPGVIVLDRLRAVSFHASDAGLGTQAEGDAEVFNAFDLAARFRFGDDRKAAMRELLRDFHTLSSTAGASTSGSSTEGETEGTPPEPPRYRLMSAATLAALPPVRWRVRDVLPAEGLASIYGPASAGKSFLLLDLLAAADEGRPWFGHAVESCPTTYLALEGEHGIAQRVAAFGIRHGRLPVRMHFIAQPFSLLEPKDVSELADAIAQAGGSNGILAIDTLNRAAPGADENDSRDMGRLIAAQSRLQTLLGGLVLSAHHSGKDVTKGLRGHSSLHAALDAAIEVSRDGDRREWRLVKSKDGRDGDAHAFTLEIVELAEGDDPPTSCTVRPEVPAADAVKRVKVPQGGNQRIVWDALGELLRASTKHGQAGAPSSRPCVPLDEVIEGTRGRLTCPNDRHGERARAALTGLVTRGLIVLREGWLWLP